MLRYTIFMEIEVPNTAPKSYNMVNSKIGMRRISWMLNDVSGCRDSIVDCFLILNILVTVMIMMVMISANSVKPMEAKMISNAPRSGV